MQNEFLKRLEQLSPGLIPTMSTLVRRSSYSIINQSAIPTLLKRLEKGTQDGAGSKARYAAASAKMILVVVSKHSPALFKSHIGELSKAIADESKEKLVEISLMALSNLMRLDDKLNAAVDKYVVFPGLCPGRE